MNQARKRRYLTAGQNVQTVRRHLIGKASVSDLAGELGMQPSHIRQWVKTPTRDAGAGSRRWWGISGRG